MNKQVGLWIDHRQAVIVSLFEQEEKVTHIDSNLETHIREAGSGHDSGEDTRDKRDRVAENHLNKYYDEIIAYLYDADSILIFGPGEAKSELQKRADVPLSDRIVAIKTTDKMTDDQIAAEVRQYFRELQLGSNRST